MEKFPFNVAGVEALQQQLYALDDVQLSAEAEQIQQHFDAWVIAHFELSEKQLLFLAAMDPRVKSFTAFQSSFAIGNRLPIILAKADPPASGDEQGKIFWPKSSLTATWGNHTPYQASGTLEIDIFYEKLV